MTSSYLGDLSGASEYRVRLEFTAPLEPNVLDTGLPLVSLLTEVEANTSSQRAQELREQYGRIPYGSPLYWWETTNSSGLVELQYIGRTVHLRPQTRFEQHSSVLKLLTTCVNSRDMLVHFRLCSRFDIQLKGSCFGIEHLPPKQAAKVVSDIEAHLIYTYQPLRNTLHMTKPRKPWKPFSVEDLILR